LAYSDRIGQDFWLDHAINVIAATYGDRVSVHTKNKDLLKFGRSEQVHTSTKTTLMTLPTGTFNETYASGNDIISVSSSATADTSLELTIEGHTVDASGNFTFVTQTATLLGNTEVNLTTPLARCSRLYNSSAQDYAGTIYAYESDTVTAGVPQTGAKVHCEIRAGENNSEKCSTTISNTDYWIITGAYADVLEKTASTAEIMFEIRQKGGVFREVFEMSCSNTSGGTFRSSHPYVIVPPNADVRMRALASATGTIVSAGMFGVLAKVIT